MATDKNQSQEVDLDRTDELPILKGTLIDAEVADDAIPLAREDARQGVAEKDGARMPTLAQSMRSVEERIARQRAEYESLSRNYQRARESEAAAVARCAALERDAGLLRASLESEQARVKEHERALAERQAASDGARSRAEAAQLDAQRHFSEANTLKESLTSRDATIVEVLHSLGERDAQLAALQQEHVRACQSLDEQTQSQAKMADDLEQAQAKIAELGQQLKTSLDAAVLLGARATRAESEVNQLRLELGSERATAGSYLEQLSTREFRRGFDENLFRELDARVSAADAGHNSLQSERDRLQTALAAAEAERTRLSSELKARDAALAEARAAASGDVQRTTERLEAAERRQAEQGSQIAQMQAAHAATLAQAQRDHASQIAQLQDEQVAAIARLQAEHAAQLAVLQAQQQASLAELAAQDEERDQEMTVLMAHLREARKPMEPLETEVRRLTAELSAKAQGFDQMTAEVQQLRSSLERTRGALEEREFLIRRLERAESNNANVLGRIQTSMERLGTGPLTGDAVSEALPDWSAELVRIDGERNVSHSLSRRTRIGRASGCELQVDSTSVSRHHAVVVAGPRETIIEDLNSTNGVIVNGRRVSRAYLNDGDVVIIGDVHFRYAAKPVGGESAAVEAPAADP